MWNSWIIDNWRVKGKSFCVCCTLAERNQKVITGFTYCHVSMRKIHNPVMAGECVLPKEGLFFFSFLTLE